MLATITLILAFTLAIYLRSHLNGMLRDLCPRLACYETFPGIGIQQKWWTLALKASHQVFCCDHRHTCARRDGCAGDMGCYQHVWQCQQGVIVRERLWVRHVERRDDRAYAAAPLPAQRYR